MTVNLFEPFSITKSFVLRNRFIRSATWEGMATENGEVTEKLINVMTTLAKNNLGVIISGHTYVSASGQAGNGQLGIHKDELIPGLKKITKAIHDHDGLVAIQLAHAGIQAPRELIGEEPAGPSDYVFEGERKAHEMSKEEIVKLIQDFKNAAERAVGSGFDAIQLHGAHGYGISQFLSPFYNKREDEYGGSLENRYRLLNEIVLAIRNSIPTDMPLLIKLNSEDHLNGGFPLEESIQISRWLERDGIDAIEISGGTALSGKKLGAVRILKIDEESKEAYFRNASKQFKQALKIPIFLVGGIRSFKVAKTLIEDNYTDAVSLSRPLICEPDLILKWSKGEYSRSQCGNDNLCFRPTLAGEGLRCEVQYKKTTRV